jgi:Ca2+-binding EF-hand superfamily protein
MVKPQFSKKDTREGIEKELTEEERQEIDDEFKFMDNDNSGYINIDELKVNKKIKKKYFKISLEKDLSIIESYLINQEITKEEAEEYQNLSRQHWEQTLNHMVTFDTNNDNKIGYQEFLFAKAVEKIQNRTKSLE